jgi:hypothetical protein
MTFATRLRNAMEMQDVSGVKLGRAIRPDAPEHGRRMVQDYLAGMTMPRLKRRRELAVGLGLPEDAFDEADEKEDDLVTALEAALALAKSRRLVLA